MNKSWILCLCVLLVPAIRYGLVPVITRVRDNGTSQNDPPDEISFSWIGDSRSCVEQPGDLPLFALPQGQVAAHQLPRGHFSRRQ